MRLSGFVEMLLFFAPTIVGEDPDFGPYPTPWLIKAHFLNNFFNRNLGKAAEEGVADN